MAEREYIKLTSPRQRGGFAVVARCRSNLWLGQDHVLCVETEGYTESYKRFYFRDIQAITVRKTIRAVVLNAVMGGLTAVFGALALAMSAIEGRWVFGILAGTCAVPFVANLLYGPTCACQLRTAVQTEDLPSMNRIRRARKVIARLRPLIAGAQGQITPAEIELYLANPASYAPPVITRPALAQPSTLPNHYSGTVHLILFWLLLADLPLTVPYLVIESGWLDAMATALLLATVVAAIISLVKQRNTDLPASLKALPWITLGSTALFLVGVIAYVVVVVVANPNANLQNLSVLDDPVLLGMTVVSTTLYVVLGTIGLLRLRRFRAAASPASLPPPPAAGESTV